MSEPEYTPDQDTIKRECEAIRAGWSLREEQRRRRNDRPVDTGIVRWVIQEPEGEE